MFIKFGKPEHIINCYEEEYLYFPALKSFRSHEKDEFGQNDPKEGNLLNRQLTSLTVISKGKEFHLHEIIKDFNAQFHKHPTEIPGNICCLYAIKNIGPNREFSIDNRMFSKGSKVLFIYNGSNFIEILDKSLDNLGYGYKRSLVNYYDHKEFEGELSFFDKDIKYDYQKEYRILIKTTGKSYLKVSIPGLKSISEIVDLSSI